MGLFWFIFWLNEDQKGLMRSWKRLQGKRSELATGEMGRSYRPRETADQWGTSYRENEASVRRARMPSWGLSRETPRLGVGDASTNKRSSRKSSESLTDCEHFRTFRIVYGSRRRFERHLMVSWLVEFSVFAWKVCSRSWLKLNLVCFPD